MLYLNMPNIPELVLSLNKRMLVLWYHFPLPQLPVMYFRCHAKCRSTYKWLLASGGWTRQGLEF